MGNDAPVQRAPKMTFQDATIQMKIQSKRINREAQKSEKQSEKYRKQAKDALKKNNDEAAKLYITSSSQKRTQAMTYKRTAIKMQLMCDQMKSLKNNQKVMNNFNNMAYLVNQQMKNVSMDKLAYQMQSFNTQMDQVLINNKMMTQLMQQNQTVDMTANQMLDALKNQLAMETNQKLIEGGAGKQTISGKEKQGVDPFVDQIKDL